MMVELDFNVPQGRPDFRGRDFTPVRQAGRKISIAVGETEDIWTPGGERIWETSAGPTIIASDSPDDNASGIGARTVELRGVANDGSSLVQMATLAGVIGVALATDFKSVDRIQTATVGAFEKNVGTITATINGNVTAVIEPSRGQTEMAMTSIPTDVAHAWVIAYSTSMRPTMGAGPTAVSIQTEFRLPGNGWIVGPDDNLLSTGKSFIFYPFNTWFPIPPGTQLRMRATDASGPNINVKGALNYVLLT